MYRTRSRFPVGLQIPPWRDGKPGCTTSAMMGSSVGAISWAAAVAASCLAFFFASFLSCLVNLGSSFSSSFFSIKSRRVSLPPVRPWVSRLMGPVRGNTPRGRIASTRSGPALRAGVSLDSTSMKASSLASTVTKSSTTEGKIPPPSSKRMAILAVAHLSIKLSSVHAVYRQNVSPPLGQSATFGGG